MPVLLDLGVLLNFQIRQYNVNCNLILCENTTTAQEHTISEPSPTSFQKERKLRQCREMWWPHQLGAKVRGSRLLSAIWHEKQA